jgi:pimeloyl-ACP methyl ester carboxylesterase
MTIAFKTLGGAGQDIVLIHGFGSDRLSWLANSSPLLPLGRVHALDLPGHGESLADVGDGTTVTLAKRVAESLVANGVNNAHLIGHSLGGGVALLLATHWPELVKSLALIAPLGLGQGVDRGFVETFPELASAEDAMKLMQSLVARPQLIGKQVAQRVIEQLNRQGAREALRTVALHLRSEFEVRIASDVPRLVIWGGADITNPPAPEKLATFGGQHEIIGATAHLPHIENPRAVNALLAAFLKPQ